MRRELFILFSWLRLAPPNRHLHLSGWRLLHTDPVPAQTPEAKATAPRPTHSEGIPLGLPLPTSSSHPCETWAREAWGTP